MRILYYGPNCGSGVEQIGFVYLLLLKSLGHTIDYINTQCMNQQKTTIKELIHFGNYDYIIFNEASSLIFERTEYKVYPKNKVFNICHSHTSIPTNVIALSLNYSYHMKISEYYPVTIPLSYPFLYKPLNKVPFEKRKYKTAFVGRYCESKFHKDVESFLIKNGIKMDYVVASGSLPDNIPAIQVFNNLNIEEIYSLLLNTQYLLLPSVTECLSLVVGEAQVCGCIPVVLETAYLEHEQFPLSKKCFTIDEFNNYILKIYNGNNRVDYNVPDKVLEQPWHIQRVKNQLLFLFGKENGVGKINLLNNNLVDSINELTLNNAEIITNINL